MYCNSSKNVVKKKSYALEDGNHDGDPVLHMQKRRLIVRQEHLCESSSVHGVDGEDGEGGQAKPQDDRADDQKALGPAARTRALVDVKILDLEERRE